MDIMEHTKALRTERMKLIEEAKAPFDDAIEAKRTLTPEEREKVDRLDARIADIDAEVRTLDEKNTREEESAKSREAFERQYGKTGIETQTRNEVAEFRAWASGQERRADIRDDRGDVSRNAWPVNLRAMELERKYIRMGIEGEELRALLWDTGSIASGVPTLLARTIYQYMTAGIAAERMPTYKFTTETGAPMQWPRVNAHGIATQVIAQGTAIGGTDPTFLRMQLDSFKYGELLQVAAETITDNGFDIVEFVGSNTARAVAQLIDAALVAGSGSGAPQGMMTAAIVGNAGTAATGGTLPAGSGTTPIPYEALVDTVYAVNDQYRQSGNCAWLMRDSTAAQLRKLRDGAGGTVGAVLWRPSLTEGIQGGQPSMLLDYPVFVDPNVASLASNAKVAAFGDWSAYYRRNIGDFVIERSDEYAFNVDEVTFRAKQRVDGDFIDLTACVVLKNSVT